MRLWALLTVLLVSRYGAAQDLPYGYERHYDAVVDATTESLMLLTEFGRIRLQVAVAYAGEQRRTLPKRVELVIASDGDLIGDARTIERSVVLRVDGQRFMHGTHNARDVAQTNAVALVFPYEDFQNLAHARTIDGNAFGGTFTLTSEQLVALQAVAELWASVE